MNVAEFHQNIEQVWQKIEEALENQDCDVDCETQGSVFTITFDDRSQIVINKQEPLLELWLASRLGGFHFAYKNNDWVANDGKRFWDCLTEAVAAHGETVTFKWPNSRNIPRKKHTSKRLNFIRCGLFLVTNLSAKGRKK